MHVHSDLTTQYNVLVRSLFTFILEQYVLHLFDDLGQAPYIYHDEIVIKINYITRWR